MNRRTFVGVIGTPVLAPVLQLLDQIPNDRVPNMFIHCTCADRNIDVYVDAIIRRQSVTFPLHFNAVGEFKI